MMEHGERAPSRYFLLAERPPPCRCVARFGARAEADSRMPSMFYKGLARCADSKRGTAVVCLVLSCARREIRVCFALFQSLMRPFVSACESVGTQDCRVTCHTSSCGVQYPVRGP